MFGDGAQGYRSSVWRFNSRSTEISGVEEGGNVESVRLDLVMGNGALKGWGKWIWEGVSKVSFTADRAESGTDVVMLTIKGVEINERESELTIEVEVVCRMDKKEGEVKSGSQKRRQYFELDVASHGLPAQAQFSESPLFVAE
ncbi:hypothetical protein AXG93_731s1220 [Marchantia polymorpha subsp. ruderalis]|uniref:Uncharacterized protein n=1 Tax=Marchantia polymorpha subsp. ruderalis TaxID=1480154 RepID=A0A176VNT6_MARPO|nr:hypothetical protein AXG93_731s1220 [Marchantia polymorpha subsp. ruderalis]